MANKNNPNDVSFVVVFALTGGTELVRRATCSPLAMARELKSRYPGHAIGIAEDRFGQDLRMVYVPEPGIAYAAQ